MAVTNAGPIGKIIAALSEPEREKLIESARKRLPAGPDGSITYTMGTFTSATVPGCRAPHVWLEGRRSLYDALGSDYTLLRLDPKARVTGIVDAAAKRRVPLTVVDVNPPQAREFYRHKLVLVRPDQHIAWRGDEEPTATLDLIDLVRGARPLPASKNSVSERAIMTGDDHLQFAWCR